MIFGNPEAKYYGPDSPLVTNIHNFSLLINILSFIMLGMIPGNLGANKYGPNPLLRGSPPDAPPHRNPGL
jgi:uncharacterized membrane protein YhaH (DUF805 family)